jgi:hypothetical protein
VLLAPTSQKQDNPFALIMALDTSLLTPALPHALHVMMANFLIHRTQLLASMPLPDTSLLTTTPRRRLLAKLVLTNQRENKRHVCLQKLGITYPTKDFLRKLRANQGRTNQRQEKHFVFKPHLVRMLSVKHHSSPLIVRSELLLQTLPPQNVSMRQQVVT